VAVAAVCLAAVPGEVPAAELPNLLEYRVTEHAPIINDRQDRAYQRALEAGFHRALLEALREIQGGEQTPGDFAAWQRNIFSRAADFIFSYRVESQEVEEGRLTLAIRAGVYRDKLAKAVEASSALSPVLPVRLLVLVDTFPFAGPAGQEEIDAGHLAAAALEAEFLRRGVIIVPSPETLPWQHLEGRADSENRLSLATVEGGKARADYVLLGRLQSRANRLLVLSAEVVSVLSQKTVASARSPVEMQTNSLPHESFVRPAQELAGSFMPRLSSHGGKR
jgi:hypothetical protein